MVYLGVLYFLSVVWSFHFGGAVERLFWYLVFEFFEGLVNVAIHADAYGAFVVILFKVHFDVLFGFPVSLEQVFCTNTGYEMINVLLVCIFDTEVVNHKGEGNVSYVMEKESFSTGCFVVSKFVRCATRSSCAISPDCLRPYHAFFIRA